MRNTSGRSARLPGTAEAGSRTMRASRAATGLAAIVLAAAAFALAGEPGKDGKDGEKKNAASFDGARIADLEALALRVEKEGFRRALHEKLAPKAPADLVFPVTTCSIDEEKKFRTAWIAAYRAMADDLVEQITTIAKNASLLKAKELEGPPEKRFSLFLKKLGRQKELSGTAQLMAPRYAEVLELEKNPAEKDTFEFRERELKKFLKRYDFGPTVATSEASGTAVIRVRLTPATYSAVKGAIDSWKGSPLGAFAGKELHYAAQISQGEVREALKSLTNEYFVVRYSKWEREKEVDALSVVGAKLLFGRYYFIDAGEKLIVAREAEGK